MPMTKPGPSRWRWTPSAPQARLVRQLLDRVLPGARAAIFGSRATGRARPCSDLDLRLIEPRRLTWAQRADLRDAFEFSTLPFSVDVAPLPAR